MKAFHSSLIRCVLANIAACLSLAGATAWSAELGGDQISGNLVLPWSPQRCNWFSVGTNGNPMPSLPTSAIVGPGIEFGYYPYPPASTFRWSITADVSDDQIRINERYSDSNPGSIWLVELSGFTLTLSDLDWAGAAGISAKVISEDPNISLVGFDAHSVTFNINEVTLYPTGPYSYSLTTVVQLSPIPEPSMTALSIAGAIAASLKALKREER